MYQKYNYGSNRHEIKELMRKRIRLNDKIRIYSKRLESYIDEIEEVEIEIRSLLKQAKSTI